MLKILPKWLLPIFLIWVMSLGFASAQITTKTSAITIEPFLQQINIQSGQRQPTFFINVKNNTPGLYNFKARVVDFGSLNETGGVLFAGNQSNELVKKYGLAKWLVVSNPIQTLAGGQTVKLNFTVDNRSDLAPGGHYAAIILTDISRHGQSSLPRVGLQNNISSLIFANKTDGAKHGLSLISINDNHQLLTTANEVRLKFKNTGNVHVVPRGEVKIIGPFGKVVGKASINNESAIILPESERTFIVKLHSTSSAFLPGHYKTFVEYRYDGQAKTNQAKISHFYVGWPIIILIFSMAIWYYRAKLAKLIHKQ